MFKTLDEYTEYLYNKKEENIRINRACDLLARSDKNIDKVIADTSLLPREYIEVIALRRKEGYSKSTGNGLSAAEHQIDLMYRNTPWKFVEEFLQNADDCKYERLPKIKIIVDENKSSVEFVYNEKGFSRGDVWALTSLSQSTKSDDFESALQDIDEEGVFYKERTGRKGIGFKSVFSLPAQNVCIHIKSNGFSFKLDNVIGSVMPIWEDDICEDENTHVIVELVNPQFSLNSIFPRLKELFCVENTSSFFQKSPILFMHQLHDISVRHISKNGTAETFSVVLEYNSKKIKEDGFSDPFVPQNPILSGIRHSGQYYRKQYSYLNICLMPPTGDCTIIYCLRETQMVLLDNNFRNISVISPIMQNKEKGKWSKGSLFRTFPMMDHEFNLPFAIDAPFELNSARKGIEYNDIGNSRTLNTEINNCLFSQNGLLADFVIFMRDIPNIRIDFYMSNGKVVLFDNDANRDGKQHLIPEVDLMEILRQLPVFKLYFTDDFAPLNQIISVENDIFTWPKVEKLLRILFENKKNQLASEIYAGSLLLKNQGIVNCEFADHFNEYLDIIDKDYDNESDEYIDFYNEKFVPFLKRHNEQLIRCKSYETLRVFLSCIKVGSGKVIVRENYHQGKWFFYSGKNNLSFGDYRIVESSPINLQPLFPILSEYASARKLEDEFGFSKIDDTVKAYTEWQDIKMFIEAASYYGFEVSKLHIPALRKYAVCKEYDEMYNPFRDAGIIESIPSEDIKELIPFFGDAEKVVLLLKDMGLRSGFLYGKKGTTNIITLDSDSIALINSPFEKIIKKFLDKIYNDALKKGKKIMLSYENISEALPTIKLKLIRMSEMIVTDAYVGICEAILSDEAFWLESSDMIADLIIRARVGAKKNTAKKKIPVNISLQYVIYHNLGCIVQQALEDRHFDQIRLINNEYFDEIPLDEIRSIIGVLAPAKFESQLQGGEVHYFCGDLTCMPSDHKYLLDGSGKSVFLHRDENNDYKEALAEYLNTSFDPESLSLIAELEESNRYVKKKWIIPALDQSGHNLKEAFKIVMMDFPSLINTESKKEYIQILSWFRFQSYSEEVGNAAANNEKEIESDYMEQPWHFVYEFLQNVDDCNYPEWVTMPELDIKISKDANSIAFTYNEVGFSSSDIDALTKFGDSNKAGVMENNIPETGVFDREKTGRMGRGFKSVFALPGKNIVVHIRSNGYSFKFIKRLGQIIPVWEDSDDMPSQGTKIIVDGLNKGSLEQIYEKLRDMFCTDKTVDFFAACPILYLRKLKKVSVASESSNFEVDVQLTDSEYSDKIPDIGNRKVVSGIKNNNHFCEFVWDKLRINIKNGENSDLSLEAVRYTKMVLNEMETRTISITAPILVGEAPLKFERGSFFRTLPLDKNTYRLPFAINAPFKTDDGRSQIRDQKSEQELIDNIFSEIIPCVYEYIRPIPEIYIGKYIAPANATIFDGYQNLQKKNLYDFTRRQPILKLYGLDKYVDLVSAKILSQNCYFWPEPARIAQIFCPKDGDVLVEEKYSKSQLNISRINLIDSEFVDHLNSYLDFVEKKYPEQLWKLLDTQIVPLITENYSALRNKYFAENRLEDLKELRIFAFKTYDGNNIRENANSTVIWLDNCPVQYASYGNYRSLNNSPIKYSVDTRKWMCELHDFVSYTDAFSKDSLAPKEISVWPEAKQIIETILYYHIVTKFKVSYLKKCVLSEKFDSEPNIFRDAYLELKNNNIISHCIDEEDIIDIWTTVGEISDVTPEEIVKVITQLGVRTGKEFFFCSQDSIRCNEETLCLFRDYCTTKEKSNKLLNLIKDELHSLRNNKDDERRFIIDYQSIKECKAVFITCLIKSSLLEEPELRKIAEKFYNDDTRYGVSDCDLSEALLYCTTVLSKDQLKQQRTISIGLSEILFRKMGKCIQKTVNLIGANLNIKIILDMSCTDYSGERISKALGWLSDSENSQDTISKSYKYYTAELNAAFDDGVPGKQMYICDGEKVILNCSNANGSLLAFVHARFNGKDNDFSTLIDIISMQEDLKTWHQSKQQYIYKLASFRKLTSRIANVLYPKMVDNINNANGKTMAYIVPELLQNINDCPLKENNQIRTLDIQIDTEIGVMRLSYEEAGFDYSNVYSITALGQSSKHDKSEGEKGLGFKKVFSLFDKVEIYSNGFNFSLERKEPTVPSWISDHEKQNSNTNKSGTCMMFYTSNKSELKKLAEIWKEIFVAPYVGKIVSPLFLENISSYSLQFNRDNVFEVTREKILQGYYIQKRKLYGEYKNLLSRALQPFEYDNLLNFVRKNLRKRTKCEVMSDEEFEDYLNNLSIGVCLPRDISKKIDGFFFSTLPTTNRTNLSLFINLPLELTTGRDAIQEDSAYNRQIMNMVFGLVQDNMSVFDDILQQTAIELPDAEIFEYLREHILDWIDSVSKTDEEKELRKKELSHLLLFHAYPDNELVSMEQSYSLNWVIYKYIRESDDIRCDIQTWLHQNVESSRGYRMVNIQKYPSKTCDSLEKYVKDIGVVKDRFPLCREDKDITVEYFREEYGAVEVNDDK